MRWTEEELATYQARQRGQPPRLPRPVLRAEDLASEQRFMAAVIRAAEAQGYKIFHPYRSTRSTPGWVDVVLAKARERLLLWELKTNSGRTTPAQDEWLTILAQTQTPHAAVMRPADWATILTILGY